MTSSAKFAVPFRVSLQTSLLLNGLLAIMYLGAMYWIWTLELALWLVLSMQCVVAAGFVAHLRQYLFRNSNKAVKEMVWLDGKDWQLENSNGQLQQVSLLGNSVVSPWLIVLNFQPEQGGRKWPVVLMPDSVDSTTFRRLSAKLRMYGLEMTAGRV